MEISMIAAGFSAADADALRRAMAAWKRKGGVDKFEARLKGGMLANGYSEDFAAAHLRAGEGLRRLRLPGKPRLQLRAAGLVEQLAQVPRAGVLPGRDAQLATHGLLRSIAVDPGRAAPRHPGAAAGRVAQRLGLHAGALPQNCGSSPQ
jgi:hypothetical protein